MIDDNMLTAQLNNAPIIPGTRCKATTVEAGEEILRLLLELEGRICELERQLEMITR